MVLAATRLIPPKSYEGESPRARAFVVSTCVHVCDGGQSTRCHTGHRRSESGDNSRPPAAYLQPVKIDPALMQIGLTCKQISLCQSGDGSHQGLRYDDFMQRRGSADLTQQVAWFPSLLDLFHMSIAERTHGKCSERGGSSKKIPGRELDPLFVMFKVDQSDFFTASEAVGESLRIPIGPLQQQL